MTKAIKNFMEKPVTWGAYFKICGIASGLAVAITGVYIAYIELKNRKFMSEIHTENELEAKDKI